MTKIKSYALPYHSWQIGVKKETDTTPVTSEIMCRGTDFEQNRDFKTQDYEGHSGVKGLTLQSDRTSITTEPQFEHGVVFGECQEEYWYLLLGSYDTPTLATIKDSTQGQTKTATKAYNWHIFQDVAHPKPLPTATICNGYSMTTYDAVIFDECKMSELEFKVEDKGVSDKVKFMSNAPIRNQHNQLKKIAPILAKLGKEKVKIYVAPIDVTLTAENKEDYAFDCIMSHDLTFKTNLTESACLNTPFGESPADEGKFEGSAKMELKWNEKSKLLEDEYYSGKKYGTKATSQSLFKQVLIECTGGTIETITKTDGTKEDINYFLGIHMPKVEITKCETQLSGDKVKTLETEYSIREDGLVSAVDVKMITTLADIHYGSPLTLATTEAETYATTGTDPLATP